MKLAIVGSLTALLAGAGLALAQQSDEYLPKPRNLAGGSNEVPADQAATGIVPVGDNGPPDPGSGYGPPPTLLAPVCGTQGTPFRFWTEGDYHLWWVKPNRYPPLLVTFPSGTLTGGEQVLAGGDSLDRSVRNGGGLTLGGWITDYQGFGLEGSFFVMESLNKDFSFAGSGAPGSPIIARPFFDVLAGQPSLAPISAPGLLSGSVSGGSGGVQCDSGRFVGAGFNFVGNICCDANSRFDFLIGYRYLQLEDRFSMTTTTAAGAGVVLADGNVIDSVTDSINTSSRFNGFDVGLRGQWFYDNWFVKATARIAFGASDESATLSGLTSGITAAAVTTTIPAGFLVGPTNSGSPSTEQFAVVPEFDLTVGYQVFDWMRVTLGYSFLYWSSVARSGDQVNLNINRLEVPTLTLPTGFIPAQAGAMIRCSDFWAQGLNAGLEFRY